MQPALKMPRRRSEFPRLPYATDALAPHLSRDTLLYHFGKHHSGYSCLGADCGEHEAGERWAEPASTPRNALLRLDARFAKDAPISVGAGAKLAPCSQGR